MNQLMKEHITALFVIAMYHWYVGNEKESEYVLSIAALVADKKLLPNC